MIKCRQKRPIEGAIAFVFVFSVLTGTGCSSPSLWGRSGVSRDPQTPWKPPPQAVRQRLPEERAGRPLVSAALLDSLASKKWSLSDLVDVALRTSSETRAAWADARSAAASYGSERASWFPDVTLNASAGRNRPTSSSSSSSSSQAKEQRSYGYSADLDWLLFNFGGRRAGIEETRQALVAANWTHNAVIQNVVLQVEQAYYEYVATKSLLDAEEASLKDAQENLDVAKGRQEAGLATIADVLSAKTALSEVQLSLTDTQGAVATTRGALATSLGLPADTDFDIEIPPEEMPVAEISEDIDRYLEQAKERRPDLAAARARAFEAMARVGRVRSEGLPSISLAGSAGRVYRDNPRLYSDPYSAAIQLRFPISLGFSHQYDVAGAKADADAARARLKTTEQEVVLEVWTSYYDLRTSQQRLKTTEDLIQSASESQDVAQGRYQAGVGTILDLLSAQTALERARAQRVQARSDYFIALARLAHDTGALEASTIETGSIDTGSKGARSIETGSMDEAAPEHAAPEGSAR